MKDKVCSICNGPIVPLKDQLTGKVLWDKGNNAEPVNSGRCCDECNNSVVLTARLNELVQRERQLSADDSVPCFDSKGNEVQNYGPPYSMANPSGDPKVHKHPLGTGFAQKDKKKEKR